MDSLVLLDGSASNGRKFGITSVGSNLKVLLLSGSSPSNGGVGVRSKRNIPLPDVVSFRLVSLRKRGEYSSARLLLRLQTMIVLSTVVGSGLRYLLSIVICSLIVPTSECDCLRRSIVDREDSRLDQLSLAKVYR